MLYVLKRSLSILVLLFAPLSIAADEAEPAPLDPKYEGEHPFVLMEKGSAIFAYHMATYDKPHNVQILYKLSVKDFSLVQLVRDSNLITIKPESFNLQRLMRGEELTVNADAFIGDYKKEGMSVYKDIPITFGKMLFVKELTELSESKRKHTYEEVSYNNQSDRFYIHNLHRAPSYEQVLHIDLTAGCRKQFNASSAVPKESELLYKFINCGTITPLYFNSDNFQVKKESMY